MIFNNEGLYYWLRQNIGKMKIEKNNRTEEILSSLDHLKKAVAPDFFYTRLRARMEKGYEKTRTRSWVLRPAFAMAIIVVVLIINAAVLLRGNESTETAVNDTDSEQSIASDYSLNDNTILYDLNSEK